jgi:gas vesicle protein
MSKNDEAGNFLGGLVLGAAIGATLAALATPLNGEEARKELHEQYDSTLDKAENLKHKAKKSLKEFKSLTKEKVSELSKNLKERASIIADKLENLTSQGAGVLIEDEII